MSPSPTATWRVWCCLRDNDGLQSVAELSGCSGLSRPTVLAALGVLHRAGWITSQTLPSPQGSGGRPAQAFQVLGEAAHVFAARISPHTVTACVIDALGVEIARETVEIVDRAEVLPAFLHVSETVLAGSTNSGISAGVVATMGICRDGTVMTSHQFDTMQGDAVRRECQQRLGFPIYFENDAKMSGAAQLAALASTDPGLIAVALHLDEAPGCALIVNHQLVDGAHGAAGELAFSAGLGWSHAERHLKQAAARQQLTIQEVFARARVSDSQVAQVAIELADRLAHAVLGLLLALDPHVLSISGPGGAPDSPLIKRLVENLESQVPVMPDVHILDDAECVLNGAKGQALKRLHELRRVELFSSD